MRKDLRDFVPPTLQRINDTLNGAYALFVDDLFGNATAFSSEYRAMPAFAVSEELYQMLKDSAEAFHPGDEYGLVDAYAEKLGIHDWYGWKKDEN
jgi:hypothetical protein